MRRQIAWTTHLSTLWLCIILNNIPTLQKVTKSLYIMKSTLTIQHQNKSKTIPIFLICISLAHFCMAQLPVLADSTNEVNSLSLYENEIGYTPKAPDIIQPSPVSQNFTRYANFTPNLSTGTINIPISLYDLKAGDLTLPIALQYTTNGIKVWDNPLPVGYGWNIQPAFRITRVVLGREDDSYTRYNGNYSYVNPPEGKNILLEDIGGDPSISHINGPLDSQHDIFTVNLPHEKFNFIIDWDNNSKKYLATTVGTNAEVQITTNNNAKNVGIKNIKIKDEFGIVYIFGQIDETSISNAPIEFISNGGATTWGLNQIILSGKQGYLKFHWSHKAYSGLTPTYNEYYYFEDAIYNGDSPNYLQAMVKAGSSSEFIQQYKSYIILNKIEYFINQGVTNTDYRLLSSVNYNYRQIHSWDFIDKLTIKDATSNQNIKEISFNYDATNYLLTSLWVSDEGRYTFEYNPHKSGGLASNIGRDYWGFYSGKIINSKTPQAPLTKAKSYGSGGVGPYEFDMGNTDMEPSEIYIQTNLLTKVIYPTGGYSEFEYEIHQFDGISQRAFDKNILAFTKGGGVRIKEIRSIPENGQKMAVKRYKYGQDENGKGFAVAEPTRDTFMNIEVLHNYRLGSDGLTYHTDCRRITLNCFSSYDNCLILGQPLIWYDQVHEYVNDTIRITYRYKYDTYAKDRMKEYRSFSMPAYNWRYTNTSAPSVKQFPIFQNNIKPLLIEKEVCYKEPYYTPSEFFYNTLQTFSYSYKIEKIIRQELKVNRNIVEMGYDHLGQFYYDTSGRLYFRDAWNKHPAGYYLVNDEVYSCNDWNLELGEAYLEKEIAGYSENHAHFIKMETNHKYINGYGYKNSYSYANQRLIQVLKEKEIRNSDSKRIKETYLYPWEDLSGLTAEQRQYSGNMISSGNLVNTPIRKQQFMEDSLIASKTLQYKCYLDGCIRPECEYYRTGQNIEELRMKYDYDLYGNITNVMQDETIVTIYLWGYNGRYPIVEIKNAAYSEVESAVKAVFGVASINALSCQSHSDADRSMLIALFKALREHPLLKKALVTGYTYKPMVGITTITDPAGKTFTYEYDHANRLYQIKDSDGNIMEQYEYRTATL